ncbi:hypothetical protein Y032_0010g1030 [Ancylostoma ceylanicum]|uniref:SCP domain-containing protein n=2 Tax=Ancylostoma ceylanicum TaxID=53326 RepID=A0A016VGS4_9BILA|nr:hypothetical protein Y032_0010g1030 [Ancylostoma ceylanicum]
MCIKASLRAYSDSRLFPIVGNMLIGLLLLLNSYATATTYHPNDVCPADPQQLGDFRNAILTTHNSIRSQLAKGEIQQDDGSTLKGSKSLFALSYDCSLEALAIAAIPTTCSRQPVLDYSALGRSQNLAVLGDSSDKENARGQTDKSK